MTLDKKDEQILKNLLDDSRFSSRQIAQKIGVSTVTVISRIKNLEKQKVIKGYTALLDRQKLGYDLTVIIEISARKNKMIKVAKEVSLIKNVCAVYDITGQNDITIIAKFKNRDELNKFIKKISSSPDIEKTLTHLALNIIKEDFRMI